MNLEAHIARQRIREAKLAERAAVAALGEARASIKTAVKVRPLINRIIARRKAAEIDLITATVGVE
jgi:ribosome biogenesis SPOUT family RNA methylase Rps3